MTGDLGIGNTTVAAALVAATLGLPADEVTGRGTGIDDDGWTRKRDVVAQAARARRGPHLRPGRAAHRPRQRRPRRDRRVPRRGVHPRRAGPARRPHVGRLRGRGRGPRAGRGRLVARRPPLHRARPGPRAEVPRPRAAPRPRACASARAPAPSPRCRCCAPGSRCCVTWRCSRRSCRLVTVRDAWLLATGTLTAVRVPPPSRVDRPVAGLAMVLAPLAVLPLGLAAAAVVLVGRLGRAAGARDGVRRAAGARARHPRLPLGRPGRHRRRPDRVLLPRTLARGDAHRPRRACGRRRGRARRGAAGGRADGRGAARPRLVGGRRPGLRVPGRAGPGLRARRARRPRRRARGRPTSARCRSWPPSRRWSWSRSSWGWPATAWGRRGPTVFGVVAWCAVVLALLLRCVRRLGGITGDVLGAAVEVSFAVLVLAAATA